MMEKTHLYVNAELKFTWGGRSHKPVCPVSTAIILVVSGTNQPCSGDSMCAFPSKLLLLYSDIAYYINSAADASVAYGESIFSDELSRIWYHSVAYVSPSFQIHSTPNSQITVLVDATQSVLLPASLNIIYIILNNYI
jgi:hypothetical protein